MTNGELTQFKTPYEEYKTYVHDPKYLPDLLSFVELEGLETGFVCWILHVFYKVYNILGEFRDEKCIIIAPQDLAELCFMSVSKLIKIIKNLKEDGYIKMQKRHSEKYNGDKCYFIFLDEEQSNINVRFRDFLIENDLCFRRKEPLKRD